MRKSEKAIFTNMCMVYQGEQILVQDRVDRNWPGITFPGGHVEEKEAFTESVIREVFEETGLTIKNPILCGVKQFQTRMDERYVVFFYKANEFEGELSSSSEGEVFWINRNELKHYQLAEEFDKMLLVFEQDSLNEVFYYQDENGWGLKII